MEEWVETRLVAQDNLKSCHCIAVWIFSTRITFNFDFKAIWFRQTHWGDFTSLKLDLVPRFVLGDAAPAQQTGLTWVTVLSLSFLLWAGSAPPSPQLLKWFWCIYHVMQRGLNADKRPCFGDILLRHSSCGMVCLIPSKWVHVSLLLLCCSLWTFYGLFLLQHCADHSQLLLSCFSGNKTKPPIISIPLGKNVLHNKILWIIEMFVPSRNNHKFQCV